MATANSSALINEQRKFPRYDIQLPASIRMKDGICFNGKTENISSNGAFFGYKGISNLEKDKHCILTLYVEGEKYSEEIKIKCEFKPHKSDGVGLEFKTMSTNDFINFVFLLSSNAPDREKLLNELKNNPGVELIDE